MVRRILVGAVLALGLWFAGRSLVGWLVSEETKIRWRIEDALEAFDDNRTKGCLEIIADDWRHAGSSVDRDLLKGALIRLFFEARHPTTKEFRYDAELDEETLAIEVTGERDARATVELRFWRTDREPPAVEWHVRVAGELVRDERGWQFRRTEHETLAGERL